MQLILHIATASYDAWKTGFDGDAENIRAAGLSIMQIWRGVDPPSQVTVLFNVADRARAQGWLDQQATLARPATAHFLNTP